MVLSKRERYFALATAAAVAILLGDRYVVTPLAARGAAIEAEQQRRAGQLDNATTLIRRKRALADEWKRMTEGGLATDPAEAESRALHALRDWASKSGLTLGTIRPERKEGAERLREITVQVSGTGPMSAVSHFLWFAENSDLPLRIVELQIGSRKEGADDLSLQIKASTLYLAEAPAGAARNGETAP
jgi:hypothetical protein